MNRKYTSHTSGLFLIELILAVFFFSIAGAVCLQLFVKAHLLSKEAGLLAVSVNECSDAAEIIRSADSYPEVEKRLKTAYPDGVLQTNGFEFSYESGCVLHLIWEHSAGQIHAEISYLAEDASEAVYTLNIDHLLTGESP